MTDRTDPTTCPTTDPTTCPALDAEGQEYVGPTEAVAIAASNAAVSLSDVEVRRLAEALTDMGAVFDQIDQAIADPTPEADPRLVAAEVLSRFASPGEDTPGFTALLDEFPDLPSRGNLKVLLWRVAGALREHALPTGQASP